MDKLIFNPKSIIGLCLCSRPLRIMHTVIDPRTDDKVTWYGPNERNCKYCGKPWSEHNL